jgi:hypothetical protein
MKAKNVRVRVTDIKQGRVIYVACPFYGITRYTIKSRPYLVSGIGLAFDINGEYGDTRRFIGDCGIYKGDSYNDKKSFFKEKHAEEWASKMRNQKGVTERHRRHEERCRYISIFGV